MNVIERIDIENFKSLRKVDLSLGRMNLFIGSNASGKSNFLEVLRVLEGIGNGFTINEILNGKPKGATSEVWEGIRGGSANACYAGMEGAQVAITASGKLKESPPTNWKYHVAFRPSDSGRVTEERMAVGEHTRSFSQDSNIGLSHPAAAEGMLPLLGNRVFWNSSATSEHQQLLQRLPEDIRSQLHSNARFASALANVFSDLQRMDLAPDVLRRYSQPAPAIRMGSHGENFAALIKTICEDKRTKDAYLCWLRQLRPEEVDDVGTLTGAVGEPMFMLREKGKEFPAPVLSDGTLRFAAITAAFFQPSMPSILTIEEIETGIHASRVQLLLELFRSQAEYRKTQIIATTHSATVLDWLQEEDYKTTFFCRRDESTGESKICSLADIPAFMDAVRTTAVSKLFSEGWLEMAS